MHLHEQEKSLIFLHIPKAAGSTLNNIIQRQYRLANIFNINPRNNLESKDKLKKMPELQKRKIKIIKGHMEFGWHQLIPQPSTYITMLRDPVERVISLYYFILRDTQHYLYNIVTQHQMTLKECISNKISAELENGQTRLLSGMEELVQEPFGNFSHCSFDYLKNAKNNLNSNLTTIGIVEKFDESLLTFQKILGWNTPFYVKHNVTKFRPLKDAISKSERHLIEQTNELDIQLYNYAKNLFEEQINQHLICSNNQLKKFRILNKIYQVYFQGNCFIKSKLLNV